MQFRDIIGHQELKNHLINSVKNNRVSHAQLFLGPEGSGSLALAIAYAQYINCQNKQENDSCGECSSCHKYQRFIHPDLHFSYPFYPSKDTAVAIDVLQEWREGISKNPYLGLDYWREQLDAGNKQANIPIKEVHDIIKKLSLKAFEAEYKVLIMWLPEYLDKEGNALLKLIEEPPAKTLFLLVAENQEKILNTIISRTQLVKINKIGHDEIKNYLIEQHHLENSVANEIAFIADGNIQEALNVLSHQEHNSNFVTFVEWMRAIVTDRGAELMKLTDDNLSKLGRENQKSFLLYAINMIRQIMLMQQGLRSLVFLKEEELKFVEKFSELYLFEQLTEAIDLLEKTHYGIERNGNPKILFLDLSLQLVLLFKYQTFPKGTQYI
ncbi:MAG: ATP-binding protein [Sphingobacterium composti]